MPPTDRRRAAATDLSWELNCDGSRRLLDELRKADMTELDWQIHHCLAPFGTQWQDAVTPGRIILAETGWLGPGEVNANLLHAWKTGKAPDAARRTLAKTPEAEAARQKEIDDHAIDELIRALSVRVRVRSERVQPGQAAARLDKVYIDERQGDPTVYARVITRHAARRGEVLDVPVEIAATVCKPRRVRKLTERLIRKQLQRGRRRHGPELKAMEAACDAWTAVRNWTEAPSLKDRGAAGEALWNWSPELAAELLDAQHERDRWNAWDHQSGFVHRIAIEGRADGPGPGPDPPQGELAGRNMRLHENLTVTLPAAGGSEDGEPELLGPINRAAPLFDAYHLWLSMLSAARRPNTSTDRRSVLQFLLSVWAPVPITPGAVQRARMTAMWIASEGERQAAETLDRGVALGERILSEGALLSQRRSLEATTRRADELTAEWAGASGTALGYAAISDPALRPPEGGKASRKDAAPAKASATRTNRTIH